MPSKGSERYLKIDVIKGEVLGVGVYRGYAKLCDLASISKADIYDQKQNPTGTQRDLSPKHARDAYSYVTTKTLKFWPEIFLCLRDKKALTFHCSKENNRIGTIRINKAKTKSSIAISRVDGNHRLHLADGKTNNYPALPNEVSFCIAYNLSKTQEIMLFRDINDNQKRMNTSHLDNIETRLSSETELMNRDPALYIAEKLGEDDQSPFYKRIFQGGKKAPECFLPLRSVKSGIKIILTHAKKLTALQDVAVQYKVIRTYFGALKKLQPEAWNSPKEYIILRGAGFWGACFIGADVIDRVLSNGKYTSNDMLRVLKSGKNWDWTTKGDFKGYSGQGGAKQIRDLVTSEFVDEKGISIKSLAQKIMNE